jgi:hypothetical protein
MALQLTQARWSVDALVAREGAVFCSGWYADPMGAVKTVVLVVNRLGGAETILTAQYGALRPDVAARFPQLSAQCGFLIFAPLDQQPPIDSVLLRVTLADERQIDLNCPRPIGLTAANDKTDAETLARQVRCRVLLRDGFRALGMFFRGDWAGLKRGAGRRKQLFALQDGTQSVLAQFFAQLPTNCVLVIDHDMGGGANKFRHELVQSFLTQGRQVLLLAFVPNLLQYELRSLGSIGVTPASYVVPWSALDQLRQSGRVSHLVFNNCVSYTLPERVPLLLLTFKEQVGTRLDLYLHDFYMLCPSHFLMDAGDEFCGVPDLRQCRSCLPQLSNGMAGLYQPADVQEWRSLWGKVIDVADEVVHFSKSSKALLQRAYPALSTQNLVFRPHRMDVPVGQFVYPAQAIKGLRIAVVGQIGSHKGSEVVKALIAEADKHNEDIHVTVIGTLESEVTSTRLLQTGPYRPHELSGLLNQHGVHLALMPSIWAETFSYVTHELIGLNVPLMTFNFGAQAEAASAYSKGRVVPLESAANLLAELKKFKRELDTEHGLLKEI